MSDMTRYLSLEFTERRIRGERDFSNELVITNHSPRITYSVNYPLSSSLDSIKREFPTPFEFLSIFHLDEFSAILACDLEGVFLEGFDDFYSVDELQSFHEKLEPHLNRQADGLSLHDVYVRNIS